MIHVAFFVCFLLLSEAFDDFQIANRIYGGQPIDISSVPYQVSLLLRGSHTCGAAIILPNFVVTAAHCTQGENVFSLSVRAGSNFFDQGGEVIDVVAKKEHEQFNVAAQFDSDICLLMLSKNLTFGNTVASIPVIRDNVELLSGDVGIATGWGKNWLYSSLSPKLRQASFIPLDPSHCMNEGWELTINMLCMGGFNGQSTCYGDSGGPLAVQGTLVGLTSFGREIFCKSPAVFTKVAKFTPWLRWNIKNMENTMDNRFVLITIIELFFEFYKNLIFFIQNVKSILFS